MSLSTTEKAHLDEVIFKTAMYWRMGYGALRIFIGYHLLQLVGQPAIAVYQRVFRRELTNDPNDYIFRFITHTLSHHGFSITYFLASYFLFWGVIDIFLSYAMIKHHLWAFKASIVVIIGFIFYEMYRFSHTHSLILFAIILVDIFFIYLIQHEYKKIKTRKELRAAAEIKL
ncbi:MAG: rane protein [Parcubacteria group bacterium]|nr:rane protein [Parcubacteria group bacterium]